MYNSLGLPATAISGLTQLADGDESDRQPCQNQTDLHDRPTSRDRHYTLPSAT
ncbi:hypothetical protein QUB33_01625 [Microcoleus sp. B3-A4]